MVAGQFQLSDATYDEIVGHRPGLVLLFFWASWCAHCRMLRPILGAVAAEREQLTLVVINIEDCPLVTNHFHVHFLPSLVLLKDGQDVDRLIRCRSKTAILEMIDRYA